MPRRDFRTIVTLPPQDGVCMDVDTHVLLMGSCFAAHIGQRLAEALPTGNVSINPFGVLYNPLSIANALSCLSDAYSFDAEHHVFKGRDGLWHSWLHAGNFSAPTREACIEHIETEMATAQRLLQRADLLCLTWGTAEVFERVAPSTENGAVSNGQAIGVVANCHKEKAECFSRRRASIDEIVRATQQALNSLRKLRPNLRIVLTISPYRYAGRGFHVSTLTKAVLHLAAELVEKSDKGVTYFPAYEIVLDELRDYRFYDRDMLHPSEEATDYVWERFADWCFTPRLHEFATDRAAILADSRHHPLHADGGAYADFLKAAQKRREAFAKKWGAFAC